MSISGRGLQAHTYSSLQSAMVQCLTVSGLPQLFRWGYRGPPSRSRGRMHPPFAAPGRIDRQVEDGGPTAHDSRMCSWLASSLLRPARLAGGERRMQRKQCVKSSPPLFRLRDVTLGGSTRAWRGGHAPEQLADVTLEQPGDMDKTFEQPADMTFGYVFKATCSTRP